MQFAISLPWWVLTLLAIAAILAFLLNYSVQFFERARMTRPQAVIVVLLATFTLLMITGVTLVPLLIQQTTQLLEKIPAWLEASRENVQSLDGWAKARNLPALPEREISQRSRFLHERTPSIPIEIEADDIPDDDDDDLDAPPRQR